MNEHGFLLVDALAATMVVVIAGGAALATMSGSLDRQRRLIDRSVETVNLNSFIETLALGWHEREHRTWEDGSFRYQATEVHNSESAKGLVRVRIQSYDLSGRPFSDFEIWLPG